MVKKGLAMFFAFVMVLSIIPIGAIDTSALSVSEYKTKYNAFINDYRWKNETAWGSSQTPKLSSWGSKGCCAYAADFEYYMYGTKGWSGYAFNSAESISSGCILHINIPSGGEHWIVVLERSGSTLYTAEGNCNSRVYITNTYYRVYNGYLQQKGYYNSSNIWVDSWTNCNLINGFSYSIDQAPTLVHITLNANGGTLGTTGFYYKTGTDKYYSDAACTKQITKITPPTRVGYVFDHFYGDGTCGGVEGERYIYGASSDNTVTGSFAEDLDDDITKDAVLYAKWSVCSHSYTSKVTKQPTCTSAGTKTYTCSTCGASYTETIAATGNHTVVVDKAVAATCNAVGHTEGSHCSVCGTVIKAQEDIPIDPNAHNWQIIDVKSGGNYLFLTYECSHCKQTKEEQTDKEFEYTDWSENYPDGIEESHIETKTQYSKSTKDTKVTSSATAPSGYTLESSRDVYGSWTNAGWTKTKPTESATLKITDTKTVTDQAAYKTYKYSRSVGSIDGARYSTYSLGYYGSNSNQYIELSEANRLSAKGTVDGRTHYGSYGSELKDYWWNEEVVNHAAVTHTEWYYQTRTCTKEYTYIKWSEYSDWQDEPIAENATTRVRTRELYRYGEEITPHIHTVGEAVIENEIMPTCVVDGSHDSVTYCTECGEELSRETVTVPATGHSYTSIVTAPTATDRGYTTHTCTLCGDTYMDSYTDPVPVVDESAPQLVIANARARAGEEIEVGVILHNNPGLTGMVLTPVFDSAALTLKSVKKADLGFAVSVIKNITLDTDGDNVTEDGILITMTFAVNEDAAAGDYRIGLIVRECTNEDWDDIELAVVNGTLTVYDFVYGDANDDGTVSIKDAVLIRKYLASFDYDTETSDVEIGPGADANADGNISIKDVVLIRKYLASFDYDTGASSVVLGPQ